MMHHMIRVSKEVLRISRTKYVALQASLQIHISVSASPHIAYQRYGGRMKTAVIIILLIITGACLLRLYLYRKEIKSADIRRQQFKKDKKRFYQSVT